MPLVLPKPKEAFTESPPQEEKSSGLQLPKPLGKTGLVLPSPVNAGFSSPLNDTSTLSNLAAGFFNGEQKTLEGGLGNILTSYIDLGRFHSTDPKGDMHLWQSTPSWMGVSQEEWDKMSPADKRLSVTREVDRRTREEWNPDEASIAYNLGQFVGVLTTPSSLIPLAGESYPAVAASGAALGATYSGVASVSEEGNLSPSSVALGAGLGAALPVAGKAAVKALNNRSTRKVARQAIEELNLRINRAREKAPDAMTAYNRVLDSMGIDDGQVAKWLEESKSPLEIMMPYSKTAARKYVAGVEKVKAEKAAKLHNKLISGVKEFGKEIVEPIGNRINAISPTTKHLLNIMHTKNMQQVHEFTEIVHPFLKDMEKFKLTHPIEYRKFKKVALDGDGAELTNYLNKYLGGDSSYKKYREVMDELYKRYVDSGRKISKIDFYFPRYITDLRGLRATMNQKEIDAVDKAIAAARARKGVLTENDINDIYNKQLSGIFRTPKHSTRASTTKQRRLEKLREDQTDFYEDLPYAIHRYIDNAVKDINTRDFFKSNAVKGTEDLSIENSIGEVVRNLELGGKLDPRDSRELEHLLHIEFVKSKRVPKWLVRKFKDYSYSAFLGNPFSAVTQLGDLPIGAFINGARNTAQGMKLYLSGKGLTPKEMGYMENLIHEFAGGGGRSEKFLRGSLKWGGFTGIDITAKGININGSVMKYKNLAESLEKTGQWGKLKRAQDLKRFIDDWKPIYKEEHLAKILKEFKNIDFNKPIRNQLSGDAKALIFSDLTKTQPLSTLDMPEQYLIHPNGRIAYMFRTFTIKYVNLLYHSLVDDMRKGNTLRGLQKFATLGAIFSATGTATDYLKQSLKGHSPDIGSLVADNLIKNTGFLDRYSVNKIGKDQKPAEAALSVFLPPVGVFDPVLLAARSIKEGTWENYDASKAWRMVPVIGELIYLFGPSDGYYQNQSKDIDKYTKGE